MTFNAALKGALKPAQASLKTGFESLFKGLFSGEGAPATPFAKGGVVAAPSYFPLGRGLGLMGEQGAEAILPLARGPGGRLGVRARRRRSRRRWRGRWRGGGGVVRMLSGTDRSGCGALVAPACCRASA